MSSAVELLYIMLECTDPRDEELARSLYYTLEVEDLQRSIVKLHSSKRTDEYEAEHRYVIFI